MARQNSDQTRNRVFFFAAIAVGAICGYAAHTIQTVSQLRALSVLSPVANRDNFEGFSAGYVLAVIAFSISGLVFAHYKMNSRKLDNSTANRSNEQGIEELLSQARSNKSESRHPVAV